MKPRVLVKAASPRAPSLYRIMVTGSANNKDLGYSDLTGAKWNWTPFDATANPLSAAYDPLSESAISDDGIAYAVNLDNGSSPCLLINRGVLGISSGILSFDIPVGCIVMAYRQVRVPVSGGGTVLAWEGYWA